MKTSFHCFLVNRFHRLLIFVRDGARVKSCLGQPVPKLSIRKETAEEHVPEAGRCRRRWVLLREH